MVSTRGARGAAEEGGGEGEARGTAGGAQAPSARELLLRAALHRREELAYEGDAPDRRRCRRAAREHEGFGAEERR